MVMTWQKWHPLEEPTLISIFTAGPTLVLSKNALTETEKLQKNGQQKCLMDSIITMLLGGNF